MPCLRSIVGTAPFPKLTAVEARARGVRPPRPPGLADRQWRVLREGLCWARDLRPASVQEWLHRFGLGAAAPRLPPLTALRDAPAPRENAGVRPAAIIALFAVLAAGGFLAVTNYDLLARLVTPAAHVVNRREPPSPIVESAAAPRANPTPPPPTADRSTVAEPPPTADRSAVAEPPPTADRSAVAEPPPTPSRSAAAAPARPSTGATATRSGNAGPIRIEMAADTVDVEPSETGGSRHGPAQRQPEWRRKLCVVDGIRHGQARPRLHTRGTECRTHRGRPRQNHFEYPGSKYATRKSKSFFVAIGRNDSAAVPRLVSETSPW